MTAAEVIGAVRREVPHIDGSTVYRTLAEMREARLVAETSLGHGESFYEWIGDQRHHHLRCASCGGLTGLDPRLIAPVVSGALRRHGFTVDNDHIVLKGVCSRCKDGPASAGTGAPGVRDTHPDSIDRPRTSPLPGRERRYRA
jgi:Fur family ferric uptake transcriptional regulator